MTEQVMPSVATAAQVDSSADPVQGQLADMIAQRLSATMPDPGQPAVPAPIPNATQPAVPAPIPNATQPAEPAPVVAETPVVSTAPVGDVTGRFFDRPPDQPNLTPQAQLPPDVPIDMPEGLNEKQQYTWQDIRARERAARQAAEQYKQQLAEAEKAAKSVADERVRFADELKARDERISHLEEDLGKLDLARKPEFQEQYDRPIDALVGQVDSIVRDATSLTEDKDIRDATDRILSVDDAEFNRIVAKLPVSVQGSLLDKRREFSNLSSAREHAIDEWRSASIGVDEVGKQRHVIERAQHQRELADQAIDFSKNQVPYAERLSVFSEPTYREDVDNVDKSFRGFMQEARDSDVARAAYQGFLMPVVQRQLAFALEAMEQWRNAYYSMRGVAHPPAMPIRVQGTAPQPPPAPAPLQLEPGQNSQAVLENTLEARLRRTGLLSR